MHPASTLPADVVGVIATFLPPTTRHQRRLMLVNSLWYEGVVGQDALAPKPNVMWSLDALQQRQPRKMRLLKQRKTSPVVDAVGLSDCVVSLRFDDIDGDA